MPFTFNVTGKCPQCGGEQFTSPSNPDAHAPVTCIECDNVTTVKRALDTFKAFQSAPETFPQFKR